MTKKKSVSTQQPMSPRGQNCHLIKNHLLRILYWIQNKFYTHPGQQNPQWSVPIWSPKHYLINQLLCSWHSRHTAFFLFLQIAKIILKVREPEIGCYWIAPPQGSHLSGAFMSYISCHFSGSPLFTVFKIATQSLLFHYFVLYILQNLVLYFVICVIF